MVMSFRGPMSYDENVLEEMNSWSESINEEIAGSGWINYDAAEVKPLDHDYRREIGQYLSENFGLSHNAVMYFLDRTQMVYHADEGSFLVSSDLLEPDFGDSERSLLTHEEGHRLGRSLAEQRLLPVQDSGDVSPEAYRKLFKYLKSDNFAERAKMAIGNSMGQDFDYRVELVEDEPALYRLKGRLGPEELVDPSRDETLEELLRSVDELLVELLDGEPSWNTLND
jgi:hypothetical protein